VTARKPGSSEDPYNDAQVCVIPRDAVPQKGLAAAVAEATYPLPRACFTKESWSLEPAEVMALLNKIRGNGVPLAKYTGVSPMYGIKTGFNEPFVIDSSTRERLVREDPRSDEIIRPYLRGQDIYRWSSQWAGQWMIFARHGINIETYPAVKNHLARFRQELEPKPRDWRPSEAEPEWKGRKPGSYRWYEIQDNIGYWRLFDKPKIIYNDITWNPQFCTDRSRALINNTGYFIPAEDPWILACLNAPIGWWFAWRQAQHPKDEALRYFDTFVDAYPLPEQQRHTDCVYSSVNALAAIQAEIHASRSLLRDWYRHSLRIESIPTVLRYPFRLSADQFVSAIAKARGNRKGPLTGTEIAIVRQEYMRTVEPIARRLLDALQHERAISDLINAAYGLTPEEVTLMWRTAPPRMPLDPNEELRRLGFAN
jgi:hypothetical protein